MKSRPLIGLLAVLFFGLPLAGQVKGPDLEKLKKALEEIKKIKPIKPRGLGKDARTNKESAPVVKRRLVMDKRGRWKWAEPTKVYCGECEQKGKLICMHCAGVKNGPKCLECKNEKWTDCFRCNGKKVLPDPLKVSPCPGCEGHKVLPCYFCNNHGRLKWSGVSSKSKCRVCKGAGGMKCTVCNGRRTVGPGMAGKIAKASVKRLERAKNSLQWALKTISQKSSTGFKSPTRRSRPRNMAELITNLDDVAKSFPVLKKVQALAKALDQRYDNQNAVDSGVEGATNRLIASTRYYMKHQLALVEISLKRARGNAKKR